MKELGVGDSYLYAFDPIWYGPIVGLYLVPWPSPGGVVVHGPAQITSDGPNRRTFSPRRRRRLVFPIHSPGKERETSKRQRERENPLSSSSQPPPNFLEETINP